MKGLESRLAKLVLAMAMVVNSVFAGSAETLLSQRAGALNTIERVRRVTLWEVACAPDSSLSRHGQQLGHQVRRKNLAEGYDLQDRSTIQRLVEDARLEKPRKIWISLPCTV